MFLTGQVPTQPDDDAAALPAGIEAQTRRVMDNLIIVLGGLKLVLQHVVSVRVFLTRFEQDYEPMNAVYRATSRLVVCRHGPASGSPDWHAVHWWRSTCIARRA